MYVMSLKTGSLVGAMQCVLTLKALKYDRQPCSLKLKTTVMQWMMVTYQRVDRLYVYRDDTDAPIT